MKKTIFLKKIKIIAEPVIVGVVKFFLKIVKYIFTKRTILFVTNQRIRSITFGPFSQAFFYIFIAWVVNLFFQSLNYDKIINNKTEEINKLRSANAFFADEFQIVSEKLDKVNQYISLITGSKQKVSFQDVDYKLPKDLDENKLEKKDKQTFNQIKQTRNQFNNFAENSSSRIKKIEKAITYTGLNINRSSYIPKKSTKKINYNNNLSKYPFAIGGPENDFDAELERVLVEKKLSDPEYIERELEKNKFTNQVEYLMILEKLTKTLPLSKPMKHYYISSGFGHRIDPMTRRLTPHRGLDFVGSFQAKIISPSPGKVVLARRFSDYGNAIVIDHGNGVTTRYGHLSKIKVQEGQRVVMGEVIGLQGSTGRSTGSHLHYEVRYKNVPLNPRRFLEAGEILNNNNIPKYVDL
ncbi:MAG: peptidoglycan DD-metalloendopeptidase family protein [Alphaproteobacteria bacterium]